MLTYLQISEEQLLGVGVRNRDGVLDFGAVLLLARMAVADVLSPVTIVVYTVLLVTK